MLQQSIQNQNTKPTQILIRKDSMKKDTYLLVTSSLILDPNGGDVEMAT